ncbi:negative regulator of genetic competence, sporulation and motility [Mobilisporobacter senegalensis]|uniref:Negative regulator of genetic competence, sporulation and motility n=2 Tax=Mobilisporobacter senegalensis TaxID=1329262 RepID=A0A3N1XC46_9FIRM|nr:negative regulator of genetic competence, sporulation and motility [Mobilisporobacter senegalensis]
MIKYETLINYNDLFRTINFFYNIGSENMKVTKINENQVRCVINKDDIKSRNTNIIELFHNREKMHSLFSDMMEEVSKEYGDAYQDSGIMMEAIVTFEGSIIVTLTKQEEKELLEKNTDLDENTAYIVYSFDNLKIVMEVSSLLKEFKGRNTLYKDNDNEKYYLVFSKNDKEEIEDRIYFLNEYGQEENLSKIYMSYLKEHYSIIVKESAVQTLGMI